MIKLAIALVREIQILIHQKLWYTSTTSIYYWDLMIPNVPFGILYELYIGGPMEVQLSFLEEKITMTQLIIKIIGVWLIEIL